MTKTEAEIMLAIAKGETYRFSYCGAWGQRRINAARSLAERGLLRVIPLDSAPLGPYRMVAIPPNAEWNYRINDVFDVTPNAGIKPPRSEAERSA